MDDSSGYPREDRSGHVGFLKLSVQELCIEMRGQKRLRKSNYQSSIMKRLLAFALAVSIVPLASTTNAQGQALPPGQVDFGSLKPSNSGAQFVEVNLTSSLIALASKFVEKDEPDIAQVLKGLQLVHVNVVGLDDENRSDMQSRIQSVRKDLDSKGWERIVTVQEKGQDVGVYLKSQNKETVQGIVVVVLDGKNQAVLVNVVGDIKPEQLAMVGEKLHIDPLKKIGEKLGK